MLLTEELYDEMEQALVEDIANADSVTRRGSAGYLVTLLDTPVGTEFDDEHGLADVVEYFGLGEA